MMQHQNQYNDNRRTIFSVPIGGCLMVIILSALAGIMVNECKRSQIRLENDKRKYQNDTISGTNTIAKNTLILDKFGRVH